MKKKPKINNLTAKHFNSYCKPSVETDRKKAEKRGKVKHKEDFYETGEEECQ